MAPIGISSQLTEKIKETVSSVLPITLIVLVLSFTLAPVPNGVLISFILGALLLILGMGLFTLGVDVSMTPMGTLIGSSITRSRKLWLVIGCSLIIGIIVTVAEPDLQVLADQVPTVDTQLIIWAVAAGVGVFLVLAMLRVLFRIRLNYLLIGCYLLVFGLAAVTPQEFLAVAFDSGGVTTGPMTVPFIMALGVGAAAFRSDAHAKDDSFGLVALCSVGPILAMLIVGIFSPGEAAYMPDTIPIYENSRQVWLYFRSGFPTYIKEVALALAPILAFFLLFQITMLRLPKSQLIKMGVGAVYTYLGLVLFLTGANMGFMSAGSFIGQQIAGLSANWVLIPIAMLIGYFIVIAEPAVHVLNRQVEEITGGIVPQKAMKISLSFGVALSLGLAMTRLLTGVSILWFLVPGYALAILMMFFCPQIFTSVAFDSGGVASGPMTATFLLPFAMGACTATGGQIVTDAFGVVAMVAMTPLVTIQAVGIYFRWQQQRKERRVQSELSLLGDIVSFTSDIDIVELR